MRTRTIATAVLSVSGALLIAALIAADALHASPSRSAPPKGAVPADVTTQLAEGARLFVAYNCGDCHGAAGSGAMGPSLQDNRWRFGGSAEEVYRSIADGRPEGMPAWQGLIPRSHLDALVAYVRTLGEGKDLSTENFTGATVERSGR